MLSHNISVFVQRVDRMKFTQNSSRLMFMQSSCKQHGVAVLTVVVMSQWYMHLSAGVAVVDAVSLYLNEDGTGDVALALLEKGFLLVESRRERRLQKLMSEYRAAQNSAKKSRVRQLLSICPFACLFISCCLLIAAFSHQTNCNVLISSNNVWKSLL